MNTFFSPAPIQLPKTLAAIRIIVGLLMMYHGLEVFYPEVMKGYVEWEMFKGQLGEVLVYIGKSMELVSGSLLVLGLFTRLGALIMVVTLSCITFFVGHGRFWYEDQHPFLFVLFGVLFFFTGPGEWSLDEKLFGRGRSR
jgi:putative oxidoreductase